MTARSRRRPVCMLVVVPVLLAMLIGVADAQSSETPRRGGVLLAGLTGLASWVFGHPLLTSTYRYFDLPVLGHVELASAVADPYERAHLRELRPALVRTRPDAGAVRDVIDKVVTADKKRGIRQYFWAEDDRTLLYMQDTDGDENFHVYGVDLTTGNVRDYTPFQGVRAGFPAAATDPAAFGQLLFTPDVTEL